MRNKTILTSALLVVILAAGGTAVFAQTPVAAVAQNRIAQQIVINGVRADAAYVLASGGGIQSYSCPAPQQYATPDGASQGWACFDAASNTWLLSALPPQQQAAAPVQQAVQQPVYQAPPVVYAVTPPTVVYASPYYYGYGAPFYYPRTYYSPSFSIGLGINTFGRIGGGIIGTSRFRDSRSVRTVTSRGRR